MIIHNTVKIHFPPRYVKMNTINLEAMKNVMDEIKPDDIYNRLNKSPTTDPNLNCDTIHEEITRAKKHMSSKLVNFINSNTRNQHGSFRVC